MPGFEPGLQTPEACIMPLYDIPICVSRETLGDVFHVKHFKGFYSGHDSGHSGHDSGQTVDILDKLGTIWTRFWTHVDLIRIGLILLPCEGSVLPLNYRSGNVSRETFKMFHGAYPSLPYFRLCDYILF